VHLAGSAHDRVRGSAAEQGT